MKKVLKNSLSVLLTLCFVMALLGIGIVTQTQQSNAFAETIDEDSTDNVVVTDTVDEVLAEYDFAATSDTECSVRITNKNEATKAIIPSTAEINGKTYKVTQVAANGFVSATKLKRVSLPHTIKSVGSMAFANCTSLERISLSNVEDLGSNVFFNCSSLNKLVLPKSLVKIGATILRNTNTQVLVRSETAPQDWSSSWNTGNANQDVEYGSKYQEPLELETVYARNAATRSSVTLTGYVVAGGQPFSATFYAEEDNNLFIPSMYQGEYILGISMSSFEGANVSNLVIEYSSRPIQLATGAFLWANCENVIINRPVEFVNEYGESTDNIFFQSEALKAVVLPDSISGIPLSTFYDCVNLTNVYFTKPCYLEKRSDMLNILSELAAQGEEGVVQLPQSATFTSVGSEAFRNTAIRQLHIYSNVQTVGWGVLYNEYGVNNAEIWVHDIAEDLLPKSWEQGWRGNVQSQNVHFDTYAVTFDACGGEVEQESMPAKPNAKLGELPVPEREHYVFVGWYDADGVLYTSETVFDRESNLQLFARWQEFTYTVTYDANRPNLASNPAQGSMGSNTVAYSEQFKLLPNGFAIGGWSFVGWNTHKDGLGESFADSESVSKLCQANQGVVTLYAQWEQNVYTITFNPNRPNTYYQVEGQMPDVEVKYEQLLTFNCSFTLKGWTFEYWTLTADGSGRKYFVGDSIKGLVEDNDATVTLYAQWQIEVYSIDYYNPYNIYNKYINVTTYTVDTEIVFEPYDLDGYKISFNSPIIPIGSTDKQRITVSRTVLKYHIEYYLNGGTAILDGFKEYDVESHVILPIPEKTGFFFGGWKIVGTSTFITSTHGYMQDLTVEAYWSTVLHVSANATEFTVPREMTEIVLPNVNFKSSSGLLIRIPSDVTSLIIRSDTSIVYKLRIEIEDRSTDFHLFLDNVQMGAPMGEVAVRYISTESNLTIYAQNVCAIYGGIGETGEEGLSGGSIAEMGGTGGDGAVAIHCSTTLVLRTLDNSTLTVMGGKGGKGGTGGYGLRKTVGGAGGYGGNGALAISGDVYIYGNNVSIIGGEGGDGGESGGSDSGIKAAAGLPGDGAEAIGGKYRNPNDGYENIVIKSGSQGSYGGGSGTVISLCEDPLNKYLI